MKFTLFKKKNSERASRPQEFIPPVTCRDCVCASHFSTPSVDKWSCKIWNMHPIDPDGWCYKGKEYTNIEK